MSWDRKECKIHAITAFLLLFERPGCFSSGAITDVMC
jgi:hypothetical protein